MPAPEWISKLRTLHAAAKSRPLAPAEQQAYEGYRDQFCQVILLAQGLSLPAGGSGRRAFRIGVLLPLELEYGGRKLRTVTLDVSTGGFSTVADLSINTGDTAAFTLTLPNAEKLTGRAQVAGKVMNKTGARISFVFENLPADAQARLDIRLLDLALERIPG